MNSFIQVAIGLVPSIIVLIIILIKRKAFNFNNILICLILISSCACLFYLGANTNIDKVTTNKIKISKKQFIDFANGLLLKEDFDDIKDVINQYSKNFGYDNECRLLNARAAALIGDNDKAKGLYKYIDKNTDLLKNYQDEIENITTVNNNDIIFSNYLDSIGENIKDYGYDVDDIKKANTQDNQKSKIKNNIKSQYKISDEVSKIAQVVSDINENYDDVINNNDEDAKKSYKKKFKAISENNNEYFDIDCVNNAKIKTYVATGDFDEITKDIDDNSNYHELMISAELYMGGHVKNKDFSDEFVSIDKKSAKEIEKQVKKISKNNTKKMNVQEKKAINSRVEAISNELNNPTLFSVKEQLANKCEQEAGNDKTKVYLELAKIESYYGNDSSTNSYLNEAIYSSQDSNDDDYVEAMSQIISVIKSDDENDMENIKNVSLYVNNVLNHSLTLNVENIIAPVGGEEVSFKEDFSKTAVEYVSKVKSSISIGKINTDNFEKITARVKIGSEYIDDISDIKSILKLYDCGYEISDYNIKKVEYDSSNIMLVCDVSGSMSGSIYDLQNAVKTFVNDKNEKENIAIVTFSSSIVGEKQFGTPDEELLAFADNMRVSGGTSIFSTVIKCLQNYNSSNNDNNILIVMTDGQDGVKASDTEIKEKLGDLVLEKGVTVYTLGLGSEVNTNYLNKVAKSGNGDFFYVYDSTSLSSFYNTLHSQVTDQYEISFTAKDTMSMSGRKLEIFIPDENLSDSKIYSVYGNEDTSYTLNYNNGLNVTGITPKVLYKNLQNVNAKLKGSNFTNKDNVTVKLIGNIDYNLSNNFVDEETFSLIIPSSVAVGEYDVEVNINGTKKLLKNGLTIITEGDEKRTTFGPYVFTSNVRLENNINDYTLKGNVTLNGWLHFNGDIQIKGELNNQSINVIDNYGSYVEFDELTSKGIGSILAKKGIPLYIPKLNSFKLYNDVNNKFDYENYLVDDIMTSFLEIPNLLSFDDIVIKLYPNSIGLYFNTGNTILPYQDCIMNVLDYEMFKFAFEGSAVITNENVGLIIDTSYEDESSSNYNHTINLLSAPMYFNGKFKIKINTIKNEYLVGFKVHIAFFAKESGLGAEVAWKGNLIPDSVKLELSLQQALKLPTTFPIEVNDFSFGVYDINDAIENGNIYGLKYQGSASFSSLKVEEYLPKLGKFFGDLSLFEMPDTTAAIRMSPFLFEANATLNFLSEIQLLETEVKIGTFEYTNALLGINNEEVKGLYAKLKQGIMIDSCDHRLKVDISGTGEVDAHTRFAGINYNGICSCDISWWVLHKKFSQSGNIALGFYTKHNGSTNFVFVIKSVDKNGKISGSHYYIDENGNLGKGNGVLG